jgi:ABC-type Fe3+/spermidine/putrescine transport system ATPase subunit
MLDQLTVSVGPFHLGPVTCRLGSGESLAVLGRSGAGKTTLLRSLAGFVPLGGGSLRRDGADLGAVTAERRGVVYVPQGLGLFPDRTVERNVSYPIRIRGVVRELQRVQPLLEEFGLGPLARRLPPTLSTGEQQRVALARALAARPRLLLWDEPLGALDLVSRDELLAGLRRFRAAEEVNLVFVTHDPTLAYSLADRWLLLEQGRQVYCGPPGPLLESPPDRFAARFAGYENVYDLEPLRRKGAGALAGALRRRCGPAGVAFGRPVARPSPGGADRYTARIDRVQPAPNGARLEATSDGLPIQLDLPITATERSPRSGDLVSFDLAGVRLAPLGGSLESEEMST